MSDGCSKFKNMGPYVFQGRREEKKEEEEWDTFAKFSSLSSPEGVFGS